MGNPVRQVKLEPTPTFLKGLDDLPEALQQRIWSILDTKLIHHLEHQLCPAKGLHSGGFQNESGVFELAPLSKKVDLRIKWTYGKSCQRNVTIIILLQIGSHDIYKKRALRANKGK